MANNRSYCEVPLFARFLPQETCFFDYFEQHAEIIVQAAKEFDLLATSGSLQEPEDPLKFKKWEHQADRVAHECLEVLHKTFITPIDREDILHLMSSMDDIIDNIEAAFDCTIVYRVKAPTPELKEMANILLEGARKVALLVKGLRDLSQGEALKDYCREIHSIEHDGDVVLRSALVKLFDEEEDTRLLIKLKEIYEHLEDAIDSCQKVANITEGIVLKCV